MPQATTLLARWGGSALLVAALLLSGPASAAVAHTAVAAPIRAPAATLFNQTIPGDTGGGTTASSRFEALFGNYDSQAADDFENTSGAPWSISSVFVHGIYEGGTGTSVVTSLLVQIFADNAGAPGTLLHNQTVPSGQITGLADGAFTVNLSPSLIVGPGRYWLSVQAYKPDFLSSNGRQWAWFEKAALVLNPSMWKQPGNGYSKNCFDFRERIDVCDQPTSSENYDLLFAIYGTASATNPVPIATGLTPDTMAPGGPNFPLVVKGINFVTGAKVVWGGVELTPSAGTGTRLTVTVPSGYIATSADVQVKVRNPGPGGGDSNVLVFHIGSRLYLPFIRKP